MGRQSIALLKELKNPNLVAGVYKYFATTRLLRTDSDACALPQESVGKIELLRVDSVISVSPC